MDTAERYSLLPTTMTTNCNPTSTCILPNPDISGIGVRIAIYAQNLLCFLPVILNLWDRKVTLEEMKGIKDQSIGMLTLAFAILISSVVQAQTLGLSVYHGNIVLNISWMNNTNVFVYFLLYVQYKTQPGKEHVELRWSAWAAHVKHQVASLLRALRLNGEFEGSR